MARQHSSGKQDGHEGAKGHVPSDTEGDAPTEGASRERDFEESDGVAELKEMEENAEDGRE